MSDLLWEDGQIVEIADGKRYHWHEIIDKTKPFRVSDPAEFKIINGVAHYRTDQGPSYGCPRCLDADFADPETLAFVPVESGVQPGTPHEATVHWAEGWLVCRKCGHTEWTGESD